MNKEEEVIRLLKDIKHLIFMLCFIILGLVMSVIYFREQVLIRIDNTVQEVTTRIDTTVEEVQGTAKDIQKEYVQNREQIQKFINENVVVLQKKNGKYVFDIQEEKEDGRSQ